jgi:hypothetical protein
MYRPDLELLLLDSDPTGLLIVTGLDRANDVLWEQYDSILAEFMLARYSSPPAEVLGRRDALSPADPRLTEMLEAIKTARAFRSHIAGERPVS